MPALGELGGKGVAWGSHRGPSTPSCACQETPGPARLPAVLGPGDAERGNPKQIEQEVPMNLHPPAPWRRLWKNPGWSR